jgi:hypothetical protein
MWGYNALVKIEFRGRTFLRCADDRGAPLPACEEVSDLRAALALPADPNASAALDVCVLVAMLLALRLGVYVALRKKTKAS